MSSHAAAAYAGRVRVAVSLLVSFLAGCRGCDPRPAAAVANDAAPDVGVAVPSASSTRPAGVDACESIFLIDDSGDVLAFSPARPALARLSHVACDMGPDHDAHTFAVDNDGTIWAGTTEHKLIAQGDSFRIKYKKVILLNNDEPLPNMLFLI